MSAWTFSARAPDPFLFESRAPVLARVFKLLAISPLFTAAFWSFMAWWLLREYYETARFPNAVSSALASFCLILVLGSYGFLHWQASNFRMTQTTGFCFGVCLAIIVAIQLGFTLFILDTEKSAYIVFMSLNLAPVMLMVYLDAVIAPPITFQQLLRLSGRDAKFEADCVQLKKTLSWASFGLFVLSVLALLLFSLVMTYRFSSNFGWQIGVAVLFCDFACWVHNTSGLASDPLVLHFLSLLVRVVLLVGWEQYWFAAVSLNYAIFVAFFAYHIIDRRFPVFSKEDALDSVVGSIESAMDETRQNEQAARVAAAKAQQETERLAQLAEQAAAAAESKQQSSSSSAFSSLGSVALNIDLGRFIPGAKLLGGLSASMGWLTRSRTRSLFRSPEFGLFVLSTIYAAYVATALYADVRGPSWSGRLFPRLSVTGQQAEGLHLHPQYQIGLLTVLLLLAATLYFLAFRCYELNSFTWNLRVGVAGAGFLVVSIGASVLVSLVTHSDLVYVLGIYVPLILVVSTLTYCNWRRQDYRWNGWVNFQRGLHRQQTKQALAAAQAQQQLEQQIRDRTATALARGEELAEEEENREAFPSSRGGGGFGGAGAGAGAKKLLAELTKSLGNLGPKSEYACVHTWDTDPTKSPRFYVYILTDFLALRHTAADYIIFFSVGLLAALCVGLGLHLAAYVDAATSYFVASIIAMAIFTVFVLLKW